jgi:hypothetical protein
MPTLESDRLVFRFPHIDEPEPFGLSDFGFLVCLVGLSLPLAMSAPDSTVDGQANATLIPSGLGAGFAIKQSQPYLNAPL